MLNKLIILVGLPGSGKTYYGHSVLPESGIFLDDIKGFNDIIVAAKTHNTIIVADPHLCHDKTRDIAEKRLKEIFPTISIEWLFWENNPKQAWNNVKNRTDGRCISETSVKMFSEKYNPPKVDFPVYCEEE